MMKKGSQFTRIFSQEVKRLQTTGNIDFLAKRYYGSNECKPPLKEKSLGYEKLSFLFLILMFGFMMSLFVVFLEKNRKKKEECTSKNKEMLLMEEKIGEYLEGLSFQETKETLGTLLNQKLIKKLNIIRSDIYNSEFDTKNCPSKIPRLTTQKSNI